MSAAQNRMSEFVNTPPLEAHALVQKGIPVGDVTRFSEDMELTQAEVADLLGVPTRTYQRWVAEPGKKLDASAGGRYYRTLKVIHRAIKLMGSAYDALQWLRSKQRALGYRVPFDLLGTEPGTEAVDDLLGRIEYGVIA